MNTQMTQIASEAYGREMAHFYRTQELKRKQAKTDRKAAREQKEYGRYGAN
jgi:hypothetical protein